MITASKPEAVGIIEGWAEEAEDGNYHGLSTSLDELAKQVREYGGKGDLGFFVWTVKSINGDPNGDVECIHVSP